MTNDQARRLRAIADTRASDLNKDQLAEAFVALKRDRRVQFVCFQSDLDGPEDRWLSFNILAAFPNDPLDGVYSVGRCLHAMLGPNENIEEKAQAERTMRRAQADALMADIARVHEKEDNFARLVAAGIRPETLARYVNSVAGGCYIDPDDRAHEDFAWYEREIVRGRGRGFELHRYLANFHAPN